MPFWKWSRTAASNGNADPTINFLEGQSPSSLNDSNRAMMARLAEFRDDLAANILTSGTSTAYAASTAQVFASLNDISGNIIGITPHITNGGSCTLNVDGTGARPLVFGLNQELPSNSLIYYTPYLVRYDANVGVYQIMGGAFNNPFNIPLGGFMLHSGITPPNSSFAFPVGQQLSRATYASLWTFAQFQIANGSALYNNGNGTTTFGIPDVRGRSPVVPDALGGAPAGVWSGMGVGTTGGSVFRTLGSGHLPNYAPPFTGSLGGVSVTSIASVPQGPSLNGLQAGAVPAYWAGTVGQIVSTGTFTPAGTVGSINGGVTQSAFDVATPYLGIPIMLRVV